MVLIGLTAAALVSFSRRESRGDILLTLGNSDITSSSLTSPYADLSIVGNTATGKVTFTLTASANAAANGAVFDSLDFNSLLPSSAFMLVSSDLPQNDATLTSAGNISAFGTFQYEVGAPDNSAKDRINPFTFTLMTTNPADALASNFEVQNANGDDFASHLFANNVTGFIASQTPGPQGPGVPEPSTLVMAGSVTALGVYCVRRQRRRAAA